MTITRAKLFKKKHQPSVFLHNETLRDTLYIFCVYTWWLWTSACVSVCVYKMVSEHSTSGLKSGSFFFFFLASILSKND